MENIREAGAPSIGIIGGGLSGVATLGALVKSLPPQSRITIFDAAGVFGSGAVYNAEAPPCFTLNHEADLMGGLDIARNFSGPKGANADFLRWAVHNRKPIMEEYREKWGQDFPQEIAQLDADLKQKNAGAYLPRSLYGKYVGAAYEEFRAQAKRKGIEVVPVKGEVQDITKTETGQSITCRVTDAQEQKYVDVDASALCIGHWISPPASSLKDAKDYYVSPYTKKLWQARDALKGKNVAIQGAGLSAADAAIAAIEIGGADKVTMFSHHGKMRELRGKTAPYNPSYLTIENLEQRALEAGVTARGEDGKIQFRLQDVLELGKQEIELAHARAGQLERVTPQGWTEAFTPSQPLAYMKARIAEVEQGKEIPWRSVLNSLAPVREEIYRRLIPADKQKFLQSGYSTWLAFQAPMPLTTAKKLTRWMEEGRLTVESGLSTLDYSPERAQPFRLITLKDKNGNPVIEPPAFEPTTALTSQQAFHADAVISTTGQDRRVQKIPLISNMLQSGQLKEHPQGGIQADPITFRVKSDKPAPEKIFAIGTIIMGEQFIINSLTTVDDARAMTASMLDSLQLGHMATAARGRPGASSSLRL